ncbi:MAG: Kae1-associated serine/threonine protein kinase [Candidatus Brockarchaeota archaeon]|nr:Kae1-associated serine/threonine protein kinase [Candidatus Brockarchaeota archaeon]MBO3768354.1 Kae1-associated serine/threonine protein kinase [Candidatus Brockarchaeota archaeon]
MMLEFPGEFIPDKLIYRGAEAELWLGTWLNIRVVLKKRIRKGYRVNELDEELIKSRTLKEASLLYEAKIAGIKTPYVLHVNPVKGWIVMSFVEGKSLTEVIQEENEELLDRVGRDIYLMHSSKIYHGDLTPSNIIVVNCEPYFIDFGLGEKAIDIEKFAEDLNVLQKSLQSKLGDDYHKKWNTIVNGYITKGGEVAKEIVKRLDEINKRGRYKKRGEE